MLCRTAVPIVAVAVGLALGGCRPDEQNRPLYFEPGKYLGKKDEALSKEQLDELRQRAERGH